MDNRKKEKCIRNLILTFISDNMKTEKNSVKIVYSSYVPLD